MTRDLVSVHLRLALQQPGCPICYLRADSEWRYIRSLLWESVNDPPTRGHFIRSLGYCPEHTWQTGLLEKAEFGIPLGNAILYEHLSGVVQERLAAYTRRMGWLRQPWWRRFLRTIWPRSWQRLAASELQPETPCRVCQIGEQSAQTYLAWLLRGLSGPEDVIHTEYAASDGLCLAHLRQGLAAADRQVEKGAQFLVETTLQRLGALRRDLGEFERKNAWDYRHETKTETEKTAWLRALMLFGGNRQVRSEEDR